MARIVTPTRDEAPAASQPVLDTLHAQLGVVPNLYRVIANSPAALNGFAALQVALAKTLDVKTRERIAIAIAQVNGCDYCLSAHSYLALNLAKIGPDEIARNRRGASSDPKADAAVRFAAAVARERGHVGNTDVAAVRLAGFSDAQIVEIVALVAENSFTNYLNEVAQTEIDFPVTRTAEAA
jgi:uncharacterized peroxidase-related enzyme